VADVGFEIVGPPSESISPSTLGYGPTPSGMYRDPHALADARAMLHMLHLPDFAAPVERLIEELSISWNRAKKPRSPGVYLLHAAAGGALAAGGDAIARRQGKNRAAPSPQTSRTRSLLVLRGPVASAKKRFACRRSAHTSWPIEKRALIRHGTTCCAVALPSFGATTDQPPQQFSERL